MQKIQKLHKKAVAYFMISLLAVNCIWTPDGRWVKAEKTEEVLPIIESSEIQKLAEDPDEQDTIVWVEGLQQEKGGRNVYSCKIKSKEACKGTLFGIKYQSDHTEASVEIKFELNQDNGFQVIEEFAEDGSYDLQITVEDLEGNKMDVKEEEKLHFIVDNEAPKIKDIMVQCASKDGDLNEKDEIFYLNGDAKINFSVEEFNSDGTMITTTVLRDEEIVSNQTYNMGVQQSCTLEETYSEEGNYSFNIKVADKAGNETDNSLKQCKFIIDKTAPSVSVEKAEDGQRYVITATDKYNDLDSYVITVEKTMGNNKKTVKEIKKDVSSWEVDGDTASYILDGEEEVNYKITVTGFDKSGNKSTCAEQFYGMDIIKPVIVQSTVLKNGGFYKRAVEFTGYIQELNFADAKASVEVLRTFDGATYKEIEEDITLLQEIQNFAYSFEEEGNYQITITAEDAAGNKADPLSLNFVIDKMAPKLAISGIPNHYQTKEEVELTFQTVDRNHDFSAYSIYAVWTNADGEEKVLTDTEWQESDFMGNEQKNVTSKRILSYNEEGNYEITFKGKDKAGNVTDEKKIVFLIDHTAPVISRIGYSDANGPVMEKYGMIYSNKAVVVEFDVQDSVSGVNENRVYVTIGTEEDRREDSSIYIAHKAIGNRYYVVIPTDLHVSEFDKTITIWANDMLGNECAVSSAKVVYNNEFPNIVMNCDVDYTVWTNQDVTFHTTVSDVKSGLKEVIYRIDSKEVKRVLFDSPVTSYDYELTASKTCDKASGYLVSVEVINNAGTTSSMEKRVFIDKDQPKVTLSGVEYDAHYNKDTIFRTEVQDVSYSNTKTVYVITRTLDGKTYDIPIAVFHSKKQEDHCKRIMQEEGLYKIYAITTDGAGNKSSSNTLSFTIDKTAPKISVSGIGGGSMNDTPVSLTFTCVESFFETNAVTVNVERTLDGNTVTEKISGFPKNAKKTSLRHTFSEDGTYVVTVSATDKAGNKAPSKSIKFSIDCTKPEIQIKGTNNYEQWDKAVNLNLSVTDSYYEGCNMQITGTRTDMEGNVNQIAIPKFQYTGKVSSLSYLFNEDGVYELKFVAKDEAGNKESAEIHFVVDCTAPEINKVDSWDDGYYQEFKLADSLEEVFKDLTVLSYHLLLNGVEYNGVDVIDEEGKYNLYVDAEDELGHISRKNIEFIIDRTAPKVIFTGVKDGETLHEKGEVLLSLVNSEDKITAVRMNGLDYGSEIRRLAFTEYGSYKIEVDCEDRAGNAVTRSIYFVYSHPVVMVLLFAGIGAFVIAMCTGFFLEARRKKRKSMIKEN